MKVLLCQKENLSNDYVQVRVLSKKINRNKIFTNIEIRKNLRILSRYKKFILVIVNSDKKIDKDNADITLRYYGIGAQIIKDLKVKNMILISRSKKKIIGLEGFGLKIKKKIII